MEIIVLSTTVTIEWGPFYDNFGLKCVSDYRIMLPFYVREPFFHKICSLWYNLR